MASHQAYKLDSFDKELLRRCIVSGHPLLLCMQYETYGKCQDFRDFFNENGINIEEMYNNVMHQGKDYIENYKNPLTQPQIEESSEQHENEILNEDEYDEDDTVDDSRFLIEHERSHFGRSRLIMSKEMDNFDPDDETECQIDYSWYADDETPLYTPKSTDKSASVTSSVSSSALCPAPRDCEQMEFEQCSATLYPALESVDEQMDQVQCVEVITRDLRKEEPRPIKVYSAASEIASDVILDAVRTVEDMEVVPISLKRQREERPEEDEDARQAAKKIVRRIANYKKRDGDGFDKLPEYREDESLSVSNLDMVEKVIVCSAERSSEIKAHFEETHTKYAEAVINGKSVLYASGLVRHRVKFKQATHEFFCRASSSQM